MSKVVLDTSIFIDAWLMGKYEKFCSATINKYMTNKDEECYIPIIVPGETIQHLLEKSSDRDHILQILRQYTHSFLNRNIKFLCIDRDVLSIKSKLDKIYSIDDHDRLIIACSIANECEKIITLDVKMYNERSEIARISRELKGYRITIIHPDYDDGYISKIKKFI